MFLKPILLGWLFAVFLILPIVGTHLPSSFAQSEAEEGAGMSDLDQELFNDLGSDLFDDLDLPAEATEAPQDKKTPVATEGKPGEMQPGQLDPSDDDPTGERGFGADPDLETPQGDPLSKIGGMMREVQQRIAGGQAEKETVAMQQDIIDEINKLLEQQNQQQQQNQNNNQQQNQQQNQDQQQKQQNQQQQSQQGQSQQKQQGEQQQQGQQQRSQQAASSQSEPSESEMQQGEKSEDGENSSDRLRDEKVLAISPEEQDALVRKTWGNLPPHLRKQISNSTMERFLPKYERLTQEYFRKLAEVEE